LDSKAGKIVLAALVEKYRATFAHRKRKTQLFKELVLRRVLDDWPTPALTTPISRVKPSDADEWLAKYPHFGASQRNGTIRVLKDLFGLAIRDRALSENPAAHLCRTRRPTPIRLTPSWVQFRAIIANVRSRQKLNGENGHDEIHELALPNALDKRAGESGDFLEFLGLAGLGQAEASSLTRSDVDFEAGRIITFRHKTKTGFAIPLYPQVRPLLARVCAGKRHNERVFAPKSAKKALNAVCQRLGYPRFTQRSLRRMFVTMALEQGVDVKTISQWQGHRDGGSLILRTYSHVRPEHSDRMACLMNALPENS
jgi:integrase